MNAFGYGVFAVGIKVGLGYPFAMLFGYVTTASLGYLMHRRKTFRSQQPHAMGAPRYLAVQIVGLLLNYALLRALVDTLKIDPLLAQVICIGAVAFMTFTACRTWVFASS